MAKEKNQFGQGIFFVISNYVYYFMLTNFYFIVCNLLFLFFFLTLEHDFSNILLYFLALVPSGPAISAICYTMEKLIREKDLNPTKDFFYGYKLNFVDTMKLWLPLLFILLVLFVDLQYFNEGNTTTSQVLSVVFFVAIVFLVTTSLYIFVINAKYKFRVRDIFKLSIYYSFKKIKATTGNISIFIITLFVMTITSNFIILFIASIICYFLVLNSRSVMIDIEENFLKK